MSKSGLVYRSARGQDEASGTVGSPQNVFKWRLLTKMKLSSSRAIIQMKVATKPGDQPAAGASRTSPLEGVARHNAYHF